MSLSLLSASSIATKKTIRSVNQHVVTVGVLVDERDGVVLEVEESDLSFEHHGTLGQSLVGVFLDIIRGKAVKDRI